MSKYLVWEPIRVPNGAGKLKTVKPRYESKDKEKYKICPQIEIGDPHRKLFLREGHLRPAIGNADEVTFTGDQNNWTPVGVPVADDDEGDDEKTKAAAEAKEKAENEAKEKAKNEAKEKGGKPSHDRAVKPGQIKTK